MKNLTHDEIVMATSEPLDLISHEKAIVRVEPGCTWTYLLHSGERVGIAYAGRSQFTVDAITETRGGAVGSSVSGALKGIQIYIGQTDIERVSEPASDNVLNDCGYTDTAAFLRAVGDSIEHRLNGGRKVQLDKHSDAVFLGRTEQDKPIMLVVKPSGLVFIQGSTVFVEDEGRTVSVSKSGVAFRNRDGRSLVLGGEGIMGLDDFARIGPMVGNAVKTMCGPGSFKALRGLGHVMDESFCCGQDDESEDT